MEFDGEPAQRHPQRNRVATALAMQAETAMPQWIYGMSTTAWDGEQIVAAICDQGQWQLKCLTNDGSVHAVEQPFNDLAGLRAADGRAVAIASNASTGMGLLELDLSTGHWTHSPATEAVLAKEQISHAEALWFAGSGGQRTHAWYTPRRRPAPLLLVKGHSGPTAMARTGLNLGIQFWTSRGWGVVDVNYGGSTGFGRPIAIACSPVGAWWMWRIAPPRPRP